MVQVGAWWDWRVSGNSLVKVMKTQNGFIRNRGCKQNKDENTIR